MSDSKKFIDCMIFCDIIRAVTNLRLAEENSRSIQQEAK